MLQAGLGIGLGFIALMIARAIPLALIRRFAPYLYVMTIVFTALVFVPGIGLHANGATRWIDLGFTTVQPAEFLKIGFVLALAWWLTPRARQLSSYRNGLIPFTLMLAIPTIVLLAQPNTSTALLLIITGMTMYFAAGAPWRDFGILTFIAILGFISIVLVRYRMYSNESKHL